MKIFSCSCCLSDQHGQSVSVSDPQLLCLYQQLSAQRIINQIADTDAIVKIRKISRAVSDVRICSHRCRIDYDLGILEKTLDGVQHVDAVHAYLAYSTDINEMKLGMDVEVAKDSFINRLRTAAGASLGEQMIPAVVNLTSR